MNKRGCGCGVARRASQWAVERRSWPLRVDNEFALLAGVERCAGLGRGSRGRVLAGAGGRRAGQVVASAQVPSLRVSPWRSRVRRLSAAARVWSQASFLVVPR
jgi:hypothetical protein